MEFAILDVNMPEFSDPCLENVAPFTQQPEVNQLIKKPDQLKSDNIKFRYNGWKTVGLLVTKCWLNQIVET